MLQKFNKHLANLAVWTFKLHNIHWNVVGAQFMSIHNFTEQEYDKAFERLDEVAEHIKFFKEMPVVRLDQFKELATIEELDARSFSCKEALEIIQKDMELLRDEATELRNACDDEGWFSAVGMLEDEVNDYNKQLWFIRAMLEEK